MKTCLFMRETASSRSLRGPGLLLVLLLAACSDPGSPQTDAGVGDGKLPSDMKLEGLSPDSAGALAHGILGQHSALTVVGGQLVASAYERLFGDLVLVSASPTALTTLKKEIIDGVPSNTPSYDPKGWRGGISEKGDDVGRDSDIAASSSGQVLISFHDTTNKSLKFAIKQSDGWKKVVLDKPKGTSDVVGRYTSLALSGGKPVIAYLAYAISDGKGGFKSELRWAEASKADPTLATDWTLTTIESNAMHCQDLCAKTEVCVLSTDKKTSSCQTKGSGCSTCGTGKECVGGKCVDILTDTGVTDIPKATGLWNSVVITSSGPMVVYFDAVLGDLKAALLSSGKWSSAILTGTSTDKVGAFCSAALDKSGTVHISFQDLAKGTLHYMQVTPPTLKATVTETIDDGVRSAGQHVVGADSVVHADTTGAVRVLYQDQQTVDLLGVKRTGTATWTPKTATDQDLGRLVKGGVRGYGFYTDVVEDQGKLYGSTFYYDAKATPEGSLEFFAVP